MGTTGTTGPTARRGAARRLAAVVALVGLAACNSLLATDDNAVVGAVTVRSAAVPSGSARAGLTSGEAFFLTATTIAVPNPGSASDSCVLLALDTVGAVNRGNVAAGDPIALRVGAREAALRLASGEGRYRLAPDATLEYGAGDSIRVGIPGQSGGFPAAGVFARLAEPFDLQAVPSPLPAQPVGLRWSPVARDPNTAIVATLRYRPGPGQLGRQAVCSVRDDGSFDVPARFVDSLRAAGEPLSLTVQRYRTGQAAVTSRATLYVLSLFESVTTFRR
jgi:hypothetical protein